MQGALVDILHRGHRRTVDEYGYLVPQALQQGALVPKGKGTPRREPNIETIPERYRGYHYRCVPGCDQHDPTKTLVDVEGTQSSDSRGRRLTTHVQVGLAYDQLRVNPVLVSVLEATHCEKSYR
jgi:hypothetical protein